MSGQISRQAIVDDEHLKLLSLGYMISAAISAFFSLFGLMYAAMGAFMGEIFSRMPAAADNANQPPPAFIGWIFAGFGFAIFLLMIGIAALKLRTAFCIKQRKARTFCMVVAAICCLGVPYGTLLGALTIVVLSRDSVESLYVKTAAA